MWKKSIIPSPVRSACIALETARKNRILIRILFPFLFYIPYTVMGHIGVNMNSPEVQKQLLSWLSPSTVNLLSKHSILIFVGFLIFYFFLIFFGELVRYAASVKKHFSKKDLISIIECLDSLTEAKNERFEHCLKNCEGKDALALFNSFTTPHQNKLFVVKSIKNLFDLLTNSNIMVGLLEVVDNKPIKWLRYLPSSSTPTVDVEKYLNPNCS
ncbi:MAG: hypothetical protein KKC20_19030, partial [Proteobacteria bacterium]|nr:hypothetical protein [Pseudomonadota bacterium]